MKNSYVPGTVINTGDSAKKLQDAYMTVPTSRNSDSSGKNRLID